MSSNRACNSSFWTKEEDKIFENTLAIYFNNEDLLTKMAEALPGCVPLPDELQGNSSQNSNADGGWRRGAFWSEAEHSEDAPPEQASSSSTSAEESLAIGIPDDNGSRDEFRCNLCLELFVEGKLVCSFSCVHQFHTDALINGFIWVLHVQSVNYAEVGKDANRAQ